MDFPNNVVLDSTFVNNTKAKCVYEKLKGLSSTIFSDIINDHFDGSNPRNLKISVVANIPTGENAITFTNYDANNLAFQPGDQINMFIDETFLSNASTIEIALTLVHEAIHAELIDRCIKLGLVSTVNLSGVRFTGSSTWLTLSDIIFNQLVFSYSGYLGTLNPAWNHDLFNALDYRDKMAQNLLDIHPRLNDSTNDFLTNVNNDPFIIGGPYTIEQLMENISWIGLELTQEYATSIGIGTTAEDQKRYIEEAANSKYTNICVD